MSYLVILGMQNQKLLFRATEKVFNNFKSRSFPIRKLDQTPTREPTAELATNPTKQKKELMNENIADEEDINYENLQNPSFLGKDLIRSEQSKNKQLVNKILMMH